MTRWLLWAPLGILVVAGGIWGLRLGFLAMTLTETDVINRYAAQYVRTTPGADLTDCVAVPGDAAWLAVLCGPACGPQSAQYHVNQFGWLVHRGDTACPDAMLPQRAA